MGIDLIVLRLPSMDRFHVEGMTEDKGDALGGAQIGQPVPGEDALDGHDHILPIRGDDREEGLFAGWAIVMGLDLSLLVENAHIHGPRVQIDAAVKFVLLSVKSHQPSSWLWGELRSIPRYASRRT